MGFNLGFVLGYFLGVLCFLGALQLIDWFMIGRLKVFVRRNAEEVSITYPDGAHMEFRHVHPDMWIGQDGEYADKAEDIAISRAVRKWGQKASEREAHSSKWGGR